MLTPPLALGRPGQGRVRVTEAGAAPQGTGRGASGDKETAQLADPSPASDLPGGGKARQAGCLTGGPGQRPELRGSSWALH